MANNNQTDAEYLVSCMFWKSLSEYTPEELKEYYLEQQAEYEYEEMKKNKEKYKRYSSADELLNDIK
jgi:hypothetical protein